MTAWMKRSAIRELIRVLMLFSRISLRYIRATSLQNSDKLFLAEAQSHYQGTVYMFDRYKNSRHTNKSNQYTTRFLCGA